MGAGLSGTEVSAQSLGAGGVSSSGSVFSTPSILAQAGPIAPILPSVRSDVGRSTTILPTDTVSLPTIQNRMTFGENLQLRVLQKLPARFYFTGSVESSFRYETNPFQFPTKRKLLTQLPPPPIFRQLSLAQQIQVVQILKLTGAEDIVFRVLPNVTAGFALTPRTRVFANYFLIRDSLMRNKRLNTTIHSIAGGVQHDIPLGSRANLQAEIQFRELYQSHQQPVFDFLPGLTVSYVATPRTVLFANALLQMRGKKYFQAPTKEIDPFYTWGALHQRGGWTFSASSTFVQNFREPFRRNSVIPVNNYAMICDFEIARRLFRQLPGMQAFVRAEPIFNMHSHNRPGLAGIDFRLFWGLRMAVAKPALTNALDSLRKQLEEQEVSPPSPEPNKPSAYLQPEQVIAASPQPIHGFLPDGDVTATNAGAPGELHESLLSIPSGVGEDTSENVLHPLAPVVSDPIVSAPPVGLPAQELDESAVSSSEVQQVSSTVMMPMND